MTPAEKRRERARQQRTLDARKLMEESKAFRRLGYHFVFQLAPADGPSHAGEHTHQTAYNEGRRAMAMEIGKLLRRANFDAFQRMEREAFEEAEAARLKEGVHEGADAQSP